MSEVSVFMPFVPRRPEQMVPYAGLVYWSEAARLWQGQSTMLETNHGFAYLAGMGLRVPIGVGVTLTPLRHPYMAAVEARSLALVTGQPTVVGYGPASVEFQNALLGKPYSSQIGSVRDYVTTVRELLAGGPVQRESETFQLHAALPGYPSPPVDLGLGVLRPRMARLAGEIADSAIAWLTPADYLRDTVIPQIEAGAASAGRKRPRITAILPLAVRRPEHEGHQLAMASNFAHSRAPHYVDMLNRAGVEISAADPISGAKAIVAGGAFLYGDLDELQEKVCQYWDAGVDEIVLNVTGVHNVLGPAASVAELKVLLPAMLATRDRSRSLAAAGA